ncbi:MAG: DNA polymerase III subunit gamma/tau [Gammaproteobacteria bacterium]
MTYQVLARKWRPKSFTDMVGQTHVLQALSNGLAHGRYHHAYLFTGTRGVGKTTLARILAKCFNCETGPTATPCEQCSICLSIDQGRFVDLIEIDAASRTKVEDTRELLDNVPYAPTQGRYKIYLIDEVHMLSGHSFNALLKTLEEPPEHVIFLLATTDPQKLPITVLSRCLQFNLKALSPELIQQRLIDILNAEKISYETDALHHLAQAANGSMRDALSLLDQAIAFGNNQVRSEDTAKMLGMIEQTYIYEIMSALQMHDAKMILKIIQNIAERALDFNQVLEQLLIFLHHIAILQETADIHFDDFDATTLKQFSKNFKKEAIQLFYQIALIGKRDLPLAPSMRLGLEMILFRMLAFAPMDIVAEPIHTPQTTPTKTKIEPIMEANHTVFDWASMIPHLELKGLAQTLVSHCVIQSQTENSIELVLDGEQATLLNPTLTTRITEAIQQYLKRPIRVTITSSKEAILSPARLLREKNSEKHLQAKQSLENDKNVQNILNAFDGKILEHTIEPIDTKE